jgi:crossover junction endodeoxyribonuclease RuvC
MSRILGIDPGLGCTGYAVVDQDGPGGDPRLVEAGAIRSDEKTPLAERLVQLHREVEGVLAEFEPEAMAVEDLYAEYRFPRTAILMGHARGAIVLAAGLRGLPVWSYPPSQVKAAVVGNGAASKEQVQAMVTRMFRLAKAPTPNDVADAMAVALTAHRRGPSRSLAAELAARAGK